MDFLPQLRSYQPKDALEAEIKTACLQLIETHREAAFARAIAGGIGHLTSAAWVMNPEGTKLLLVFGSKLGGWKLPGEHVESESEVWEVAHREASRALGGGRVEAEEGIVGLYRREVPEYWNTPGHWHFEVVWGFRAEQGGELPHGARWVLLGDVGGLWQDLVCWSGKAMKS